VEAAHVLVDVTSRLVSGNTLATDDVSALLASRRDDARRRLPQPPPFRGAGDKIAARRWARMEARARRCHERWARSGSALVDRDAAWQAGSGRAGHNAQFPKKIYNIYHIGFFTIHGVLNLVEKNN